MVTVAGTVQCVPEGLKRRYDLTAYPAARFRLVFHVRKDQHVLRQAQPIQAVRHVSALVPAAAGIAELRVVINGNLHPGLSCIDDFAGSLRIEVAGTFRHLDDDRPHADASQPPEVIKRHPVLV